MADENGAIIELQVEGLVQLKKALEEHKGKLIFMMFTGAIDETGDSWCIDCRKGRHLSESIEITSRKCLELC